MNTSLHRPHFPHLPHRPRLSTLRHSASHTALTNRLRRYDRPEVERNASPSELAMRQVNNIPLMRR